MSLNGPNNSVPYVFSPSLLSLTKMVASGTEVISPDNVLKVIPSGNGMQIALVTGSKTVYMHSYSNALGDYCYAKLSAGASGTTGTDMPFAGTDGRNIPISSGVFQLYPGRIYALEAFLNGTATQPAQIGLQYTWVDATTNVQLPISNIGWIISPNFDYGGAATDLSTVSSTGIIKPTVNTSVKVRVIAFGGSNVPTIQPNRSFARIMQVGCTGLPTNSSTLLTTSPIYPAGDVILNASGGNFSQNAEIVAEDGSFSYDISVRATGLSATPYIVTITKTD